MFKDSKETWYRQLNFPTTEFRWSRRKGPGLPFILEVRSSGDPDMKFEYEVMDLANAPIGAYLRLAEGKILEQMELRVQDEKRKRSEQFDRTERERTEREHREELARQSRLDAAKKEKEQLGEGGLGEPERQAEGDSTKEDDSGGDDEVQHDRLPNPVKKKRGRPAKRVTAG